MSLGDIMSVPIEDFKVRLKKALAYRNMKPIDLANKLNLNKGIISGYLNGKCLPKQKRLMDISKAIGVSEVYLLGYDVDIEDFSIYIEKYKHLSTPNKKVVNKVIDSLIEEKE